MISLTFRSISCLRNGCKQNEKLVHTDIAASRVWKSKFIFISNKALNSHPPKNEFIAISISRLFILILNSASVGRNKIGYVLTFTLCISTNMFVYHFFNLSYIIRMIFFETFRICG